MFIFECTKIEKSTEQQTFACPFFIQTVKEENIRE